MGSIALVAEKNIESKRFAIQIADRDFADSFRKFAMSRGANYGDLAVIAMRFFMRLPPEVREMAATGEDEKFLDLISRVQHLEVENGVLRQTIAQLTQPPAGSQPDGKRKRGGG